MRNEHGPSALAGLLLLLAMAAYWFGAIVVIALFALSGLT